MQKIALNDNVQPVDIERKTTVIQIIEKRNLSKKTVTKKNFTTYLEFVLRPVKECLNKGFIDLNLCHCGKCEVPEKFQVEGRVVVQFNNGELLIYLRNN